MKKNNLFFEKKEEPSLELQKDASDISISDCSNNKDNTSQTKKTYRCLQCCQIPLLKLKDNENKISIICPNKHTTELWLSNYINQNAKQPLNKVICSLCSTPCESKKKYKYCPDCKLIFCRNCLKIHKAKFYKKHKPISIKKMDTICNIHKLHFNYYCFSCNKNICDNCLKFHKVNNHEIINFNDINLSKEDIKLLKNNLLNENKIIDEAIDIFKKTILSLQKKFDDIIKHKKEVLLFKNNLTDIYERKGSNFQCIENVNKLFFYNKHFKHEPDRNELDTLFELFNYLNCVDNPENCWNLQNFKKNNKKNYNENNNQNNINTDSYNFNSVSFKNSGLNYQEYIQMNYSNTYNELINNPTEIINIISNGDISKGRICENNEKDESNNIITDNNIVNYTFKTSELTSDQTKNLRESNKNDEEAKITKNELKNNENNSQTEKKKLNNNDDNNDDNYSPVLNTEPSNYIENSNSKKNKINKKKDKKSKNKSKKKLSSQNSKKDTNKNNDIIFFDFKFKNDNLVNSEGVKSNNIDNNYNNKIKNVAKLNNIVSEIDLKSNKINIDDKNNYLSQMSSPITRLSLSKTQNNQYNLFNSPIPTSMTNKNNPQKLNRFTQSEKQSSSKLIHKFNASTELNENSIEKKYSIKTFLTENKNDELKEIENSYNNTSIKINKINFNPIEQDSPNMYEIDYSNIKNFNNLINNRFKKSKDIQNKQSNNLTEKNNNNKNNNINNIKLDIIPNLKIKKINNTINNESDKELNYSLPLTMTTNNTNQVLPKFDKDIPQQPRKYTKKHIGNYNNIFNRSISADKNIKKSKNENECQNEDSSKQDIIITDPNIFDNSLDYSKRSKYTIISQLTCEDNSSDENRLSHLGKNLIFSKKSKNNKNIRNRYTENNNELNDQDNKENDKDNEKKRNKKKLKKKKIKKYLELIDINNEYNYEFEDKLDIEKIILNNRSNNESMSENIEINNNNENNNKNNNENIYKNENKNENNNENKKDNNNENKKENNNENNNENINKTNEDLVSDSNNELIYINIINSVHKKSPKLKERKKEPKIYKSVDVLEAFSLNDTNNNNNINPNENNSHKKRKKLANKNGVMRNKSFDNIIPQSNYISNNRISSTNNFLFAEKINSMKINNGISCIQEITSEIFCVGDLIGEIKIFELSKYKNLQNIKEHNDKINSLFLLYDGTILSSSNDHTMKKIKLINQYKDYCIQFIFTGYENYIIKGIELHKGHKILSCSLDEILCLWELEDNLSRIGDTDENYVNNLKFNKGEKVMDLLEFNKDIFVTISDKNIKFWDTENISVIKTINNLKGNCINNSLCKLNDEILTVMFNHEIQIINVKNYEIVNTLEIGLGILNCILKLDDESILIAEEINAEHYCAFYIRQYVFDENELVYVSYKKEKYTKNGKNNNKEIKSLVQFSNGIIVEGINSEYEGNNSGDIFFYN